MNNLGVITGKLLTAGRHSGGRPNVRVLFVLSRYREALIAMQTRWQPEKEYDLNIEENYFTQLLYDLGMRKRYARFGGAMPNALKYLSFTFSP